MKEVRFFCWNKILIILIELILFYGENKKIFYFNIFYRNFYFCLSGEINFAGGRWKHTGESPLSLGFIFAWELFNKKFNWFLYLVAMNVFWALYFIAILHFFSWFYKVQFCQSFIIYCFQMNFLYIENQREIMNDRVLFSILNLCWPYNRNGKS